MLYTKLRLDFKYAPRGRFYRVLLIKGNPDLFKLGIAFLTILGAAFEHSFEINIKKGKESYVTAPFLKEPLFGGLKYLGNYHLRDLPNKFDFEYDIGDGWDFVCTRYKINKNIKEDNKDLIVLEGKGQGIWEDNIGTLYALIDGEINPKETKENSKKGIYKPWNFKINKFGDFDLPLNIEEINKSIDESYKNNYQKYYKYEENYIKKNHINLGNTYSLDTSLAYSLKYDLLDELYSIIQTYPLVKEFHNKLKYKYHEDLTLKIMVDEYYNYKIFTLLSHKEFNEEEYVKNLFKYLINEDEENIE